MHCHSNFSFLDGASHIEELVLQARELGYPALALTDHNGLYGAMEFARAARAWDIQPITGAEVTLSSGHHLTLLVESPEGYANLCQLITASHIDFDNPQESLQNRGNPRLDPALFAQHASGLIALSGCRQGEIPTLLDEDRAGEARDVAERYRELFGPENFFIELQRNLVDDETERVRALLRLARDLDLPVVATNNVHYHLRARSRLQDVLVAIRNRATLETSHRVRRPNSEFFLKSADEMARLFTDIPEALTNTLRIAERCRFGLSTDLQYRFPEYWEAQGLHAVARGRVAKKEENGRTTNSPLPNAGRGGAVVGELVQAKQCVGKVEPSSSDTILRDLCRCQVRERYEPGEWAEAERRLEEELALVRRHGLAGFFLIYRDILELGKGIARELYGAHRSRAPGRGRGSSVGSIVCYLIGLSPIDPLRNNLFLGRFLNESMATVPDIDLDFSREVREQLILKVYEHFGNEHVALVCTFPTYKLRSAVREVGKALGLPEAELARLAKLAGGAHLGRQARRGDGALPGVQRAVGGAALAGSGRPRGADQGVPT